MYEQPFAYSLTHAEGGWVWCVYDLDGETVDRGEAFQQSDAQDAIERSIRTAALSRLA